MGFSLEGKTALVTGGSRGLGKVICMHLAEAGAKVIINYANNKKNAQETADIIEEKGGRAFTLKADITDENQVSELLNKAKKATGTDVDILVNNATGPQPELSLEESTWDDYLTQLEFFVKAPLLLTKAVLPGMKRKGGGRIINIGSEVVQLGNPHFANYVTAKSSQIGMTRSWANELGPHEITVNMVNPGFIPVERHGDKDPSEYDGYRNQVPLRKMGKPQDIGNTITFLCSDEANFITGQSISVNGGNTFGV